MPISLKQMEHWKCKVYMYSVGDEGATWHWATQCTTPWIHWGSTGLHHWQTSWTAREKIKPPTSIFLTYHFLLCKILSCSFHFTFARAEIYTHAHYLIRCRLATKLTFGYADVRRISHWKKSWRNQPLAMIGNRCLRAYIACLFLLVLVSLLYQTYALWRSTQRGGQRVPFDREQMCRNINTSGTHNIQYSIYFNATVPSLSLLIPTAKRTGRGLRGGGAERGDMSYTEWQ